MGADLAEARTATVQLVLRLALTSLPVTNRLFDTAPIGPAAWVPILGVALVAWALVAVDERVPLARRQGAG